MKRVALQPAKILGKERGIVTRVAHVEVEVDVGIAAVVSSTGLTSSTTGGKAGSTALGGGEFVFGRLAIESVGELVNCEAPNGGVEADPVDTV